MNNAAEFKVKEDDVFGRIASRYDLLCDLFSFGIHRLWKRKVAQMIVWEPLNKYRWRLAFSAFRDQGNVLQAYWWSVKKY